MNGPRLLAAWLLLAAIGLAAPSSPAGGAASPPYPHRFLISDRISQKLLIIEKDGAVSWEYAQPGWVYDGERLSNGNVLYCWFSGGKTAQQAGVREVTPDKRVVFEYPIAGECHSVQRLPDGLTLIEDPANRRLLEVNRQGEIIHIVPLQVSHNQVHRVARQCRKLPDGNYLVAQELDEAVVEYAPDGRVLRRFPVGGQVFGISRLQNGNTLVGAGGGKRVVELDPRGHTVWTFEPADFPVHTNLDWVLGARRMANGNTVIAQFLGHGKDGQGISILEVTPDKQVRWTFAEKRIVLLMQILDE
jgi:hypothetical protein